MRLDYLTIFPDYLAPLQLSLPGKAIASGLLDIQVQTCGTGRGTSTGRSTTLRTAVAPEW